MESRTYLLLEFPKILDALAACCRSDSGRQASHALTPARDVSEVARRQRRLRQAMAWAGESRVDCPSFPDLAGVWTYVQSPSRILDLDALWAVGQFVTAAKYVRQALLATDGPRWPELHEEAANLAWPEMTAASLKRCLSDDGHLKDESSPELWSVRQEIRAIHQQCTRRVKEYVAEQGIGTYLQDDFMTISSDRYVLPLKSNFKGKVPGIIHDYSQTGETCYIEPLFLVEVNNKLQELKQEEREAEARVMAHLTGLIRQELDALQALFLWLASMDLLLAKVRLADQMQARSIDIVSGGELNLRTARHPLLVLSGHAAKPVDVQLKGEHRVLIISGGNAGGKTVALKTAGLLALMALSGLPVPVGEGSTLPLLLDIHVFMGDEQSLEGQLSTFSAQISHVAAVWENIGSQSLVLLDEFGAGTDPSQGAALAQAVVDGLLEKGAWAAVATHFPSLKAYALTREGVRSASVLFDPKNNKPLYSLAYDQVGASQAMEVAREYGLPDSILTKAEQYLLVDGADTGRLIERLNALTVEREEELTRARELRRALDEQKTKLRAGFEREKAALLQEIKKQAQDVLLRLREEKVSRRQALRELARTRKELEAESESPSRVEEKAWEDFQIGESVSYPAWNKSGTIQEKDERRKALKVELGGVSLWLPYQDVTPRGSGSQPQQAASGSVLIRKSPDQAMPLRLDLRGQRADEALSLLAAFLDRALLRGSHQVEIIHGRGTGALRREVHQFLKDHPVVASYATANEDEGGDGMTMVTLR
ncbi:DNA mismatch repair protein MutS2 [Desulfonatronum thiosulfatophilum]|uniref:Endonuclease MutS2 n=1 Tax=Desulfonatronum thiosulfatophilum TaxID=617002 RepID=A0A1G6BAL9_9BACT|nr:endonuclease MutS2 [Desulfonatronum thiosulfatophilum]SDB17589.1 DNA mismatch repair protein MutS2 [Desulfonatronum thiosulfatophilum]